MIPTLTLAVCLALLAVLVLGGILHGAGKAEAEIERLTNDRNPN